MLKVVCVVDKPGTALDRLSNGVAKYHDNIEFKVVAVHPKRPDEEQLQAFVNAARDADLIDWQYYRTANLLKQMYPWLAEKKQILTHHNPYSIEESDWSDFDAVVANNMTIYERLGTITTQPLHYIPLAADTDFWTFNTDWQPGKNVIMVANRIEGKKGILPVAIACAELNLHFILVGSISDPNYFQAIMATGNVEFHEQISDEALRELYYKSTIHVCNSVDNFESGTLPMLEAMLCGVPVLTRTIGHVPELYNGENLTILEGISEDVLGIQAKLLEMISDKKKLAEQRERAWQTAKARSFERRAYMYQKLYREVLWPDQQSVTVVVPIYDKPEVVRKCLNAIAEQAYNNIEAVIADDATGTQADSNKTLVDDFAKYVSFPVRYVKTGVGDDMGTKYYGLARARNEATIEATGEVMVYCDQRMIMEPNCVEEFVKNMPADKAWLYGNKGGKKEFVENLSCIKREDVIDFGLFNERMDAYGGLSQETRNRFKHQGGRTVYVETAKATPTGKSSNRNRKRQEIIKMKNRLYKMSLD